eukprot:scaffold241987_cov22-Tisochrysis_lutea.AAC.1
MGKWHNHRSIGRPLFALRKGKGGRGKRRTGQDRTGKDGFRSCLHGSAVAPAPCILAGVEETDSDEETSDESLDNGRVKPAMTERSGYTTATGRLNNNQKWQSAQATPQSMVGSLTIVRYDQWQSAHATSQQLICSLSKRSICHGVRQNALAISK